MYFYNGTVFPIGQEEIGEKIGNAHKMIVEASIDGITRNLKAGISKTKIIEDCKNWLNVVEKNMCDIEAEMGLTSEKTIKELCARCNMFKDLLMLYWAININTLLILKELKQDNENGILCVQSLGN